MAAADARLAGALVEADAELAQRQRDVGRAEAELHACRAGVEQKARELDMLNRRLEHITASVPKGEDAGVLACLSFARPAS